MSNIDKIRQEIERRLRRENEIIWNAKKRGTYPSPSCEYNLLTLTSLRDFIDTLSEEPDKSLEEAAKEYATTHLRNNEFPTADCAFIAGAKWGAKHLKK